MTSVSPELGVVSIWGGGLIGSTLASALSAAGVRCLIYDPDHTKVRRLNRLFLPAAGEQGCQASRGFGKVRATRDWQKLISAGKKIHVLCVPTEFNGEPQVDTLIDVLTKISSSPSILRPLTVIIESTISPKWIETIINPLFSRRKWQAEQDYYLVCSPRRDWFSRQQRDYSLRTVPKIVGASSPVGLSIGVALYEKICDTLVIAPDAEHAAMVKLTENYFRYQNVLLATQLAASYPRFDIPTILRLAGTKWNMDLYHPSLGIGGYCIPLAPCYLREMTSGQDFLRIADLTQIEEELRSKSHQSILHRLAEGAVGVLGLCYAPELKKHDRSPTLSLVSVLRASGRDIRLHDPYYTAEEINQVVGVRSLRFPTGLSRVKNLILVTGHGLYLNIRDNDLFKYLKPGTHIIDNLGVWRNRRFPKSLTYIEVGSVGFFGDPPEY